MKKYFLILVGIFVMHGNAQSTPVRKSEEVTGESKAKGVDKIKEWAAERSLKSGAFNEQLRKARNNPEEIRAQQQQETAQKQAAAAKSREKKAAEAGGALAEAGGAGAVGAAGAVSEAERQSAQSIAEEGMAKIADINRMRAQLAQRKTVKVGTARTRK